MNRAARSDKRAQNNNRFYQSPLPSLNLIKVSVSRNILALRLICSTEQSVTVVIACISATLYKIEDVALLPCPACRAMLDNTELNAEKIVRQALQIASEICIYTNNHISVETLAST